MDGTRPGPPTDPFPSASSKAPSEGSPSSDSHASSTASDTSASSPSSSSASTASAKTGTQLKALFPGNAALPKPWQRYEQSAIDSGDTLDEYGGDPLFSGDPCSSIDDASIPGLLIGWRVSHAHLELSPPDSPGLSVNMDAAGFKPGDAAKQLAAIKTYMARCRSFTATDMFTKKAVTETVKVTPVPGVGEEAYEIDVIPNNATTYGTHICVARVGDVLFGDDSLTQNDKADLDVQMVLKLMAANYKP